MTRSNPWTTTVVDVGARYGVHPTWRGYEAPLDYTMFEPEPREAARLASKYATRDDVAVRPVALGAEPDATLTLYLTAHKGYVGTTPPNLDSLWFAEVRKDEGAVEGTVEVPCTTLDAEFADNDKMVDFLKIDVEGEEVSVLQGGARTIERALAMRVEMQFDDSFSSQTASAILSHVIDECGFRLMRFDYGGKGQPLSYLVGDPGYGALLGCDGVFVRKVEDVAAWDRADAVPALVKLAAFSLRNSMADYAVACLRALHDLGGTGEREEPDIHRYVRKLFTFAAGRVRGQSSTLYQQAQQDYERFFGERMLDRNEVYESDWLNPG